ncbi:MAG: hypothetical protein IJO95_01730 [Clostridia bacterium]|nr:hypothetical protein [Clostridia bacterium]
MNWSRAKTMLIMLLAAVNIYLAFNIHVQLHESAERETTMASEACDLLESRGFHIDRAVLLDLPETVASYVFERNEEAEANAAGVLLERMEESTPGGGIRTFVSENGAVTFRSGGFVEIIYDGMTEDQLAAFLDPGTGEGTGTELLSTEDGYGLSLNGIRIKGAKIEKNASGYMGTWIFSSSGKTDGTSASRASLILNMGRLLGESGLASVDDAECIYVLSPQQNGSLRLVPAWQLSCGETILLMNAVTGELMS